MTWMPLTGQYLYYNYHCGLLGSQKNVLAWDHIPRISLIAARTPIVLPSMSLLLLGVAGPLYTWLCSSLTLKEWTCKGRQQCLPGAAWVRQRRESVQSVAHTVTKWLQWAGCYGLRLGSELLPLYRPDLYISTWLECVSSTRSVSLVHPRCFLVLAPQAMLQCDSGEQKWRRLFSERSLAWPPLSVSFPVKDLNWLETFTSQSYGPLWRQWL